MPNNQLTEKCQFVKETVIILQLGARVQNVGATGPPQLYTVTFCCGPVLYASVYWTTVIRRTSHQDTGIQKSTKFKCVYAMIGEP